MDRSAPTEVDIHPLLQQRHSPYAYDSLRFCRDMWRGLEDVELATLEWV